MNHYLLSRTKRHYPHLGALIDSDTSESQDAQRDLGKFMRDELNFAADTIHRLSRNVSKHTTIDEALQLAELAVRTRAREWTNE